MLVYQKPEQLIAPNLPRRLSPEKAFLFENKGTLKILEIGSNGKEIENYFKEKGHQYISFDLANRDALHNGDMNFLPYHDRSFDAVLINSTLQYSSSPERTILEISRVLTKDGILVGSVAFLEPGVWKSHTHFTYRGVNELLRRCDFLPLNIWTSWSVIEALEIAIVDDTRVTEKTELLMGLAKLKESKGYEQLSTNMNFAAGLNFHAIKTESK